MTYNVKLLLAYFALGMTVHHFVILRKEAKNRQHTDRMSGLLFPHCVPVPLKTVPTLSIVT